MDETFKFFVDQVVRQYHELKADIRTEIGALKAQLADDVEHAEADLKVYKESVDQRFRHIEQQLDDLKQFRWRAAGAVAAALFVVEVICQTVEVWWKHLHG